MNHNERLRDELELLTKTAIKDRLFPGCVIGVIQAQGDPLVMASGNYIFENDAPQVVQDTIYDVASVTKAFPTATVALKLIESGVIGLDDQLIHHLPEFNNNYRDVVTIRHLLSQSLDCSVALSSLKDRTPQEIIDAVLTSDFKNPPGLKYFSTNTASILLSLVIERVTNKNLQSLSEELFFKPLGMTHSTMLPEVHPRESVVPTEYDTWRNRVIQGEVHDESTYTLRPTHIAGSSGLFSTAPNLLTFCRMILRSGLTEGGERILKPETIALMHTNQFNDPSSCSGLGWDLQQPWYMGDRCSEKAIGRTGFTGCSIVIDIEKDVAFVILSNHHFPTRRPNSRLINRFRKNVADTILTSLTQLPK